MRNTIKKTEEKLRNNREKLELIYDESAGHGIEQKWTEEEKQDWPENDKVEKRIKGKGKYYCEHMDAKRYRL